MLGAALTKNKELPDENPRTSLFERIRSFIEKRLDDPDMSPSTVAGRTAFRFDTYICFSASVA